MRSARLAATTATTLTALGAGLLSPTSAAAADSHPITIGGGWVTAACAKGFGWCGPFTYSASSPTVVTVKGNQCGGQYAVSDNGYLIGETPEVSRDPCEYGQRAFLVGSGSHGVKSVGIDLYYTIPNSSIRVDEPESLPRTASDCTDLAWRDYGFFRSEAECLIVAETGEPAPPGDTPTVDNGGFERGDLAGWSEWHPDGQAAAWGVDGVDAHSGDRKLYFWSTSSYAQSVHQSVRRLSAGTYRVSAWVELTSYTGAPPNTARLELDYNTAVELEPTGTWTKVQTDIAVAGPALDIGFYLNAPGYTSLQVDDVSLTKVG